MLTGKAEVDSEILGIRDRRQRSLTYNHFFCQKWIAKTQMIMHTV